jgi:hypothetical protein
MPSPPEEKVHRLEDFAALLGRLEELGFEVVVIGGCAVGAYAALRGEDILTRDLDMLADPATLGAIVAWGARSGIQVLKTPKPRSVPVAVLRWEGKEINIVTDSIGLPEAREAARNARTFVLSQHGGVEVEVADPFDILRNKVLVDRPKDRPHVEALRRFVEEEVVEAFEKETAPRRRIRPAQLYLEATRSRELPAALAARLLPLARLPVDFRFLLSAVPEEAQARELMERARRAPLAAAVLAELEEIVEARRFGGGRVPPGGEVRARPRAKAPLRRGARAPFPAKASRAKRTHGKPAHGRRAGAASKPRRGGSRRG